MRLRGINYDVGFSPFPCEMIAGDMLGYFADCAERAETARRTGAEVLFVTGCALSVFAAVACRAPRSWSVWPAWEQCGPGSARSSRPSTTFSPRLSAWRANASAGR